MKEEIERRRAEAAEKRQKVEDTMDGEGKPFKCLSPRGSSLKVSPIIFDSSPHIFSLIRITVVETKILGDQTSVAGWGGFFSRR